jgi:pimeloyl-ACP methyl ester carboxylesterase
LLSENFRAELATITTPTLILWGERDLILPLALGNELSLALPHASFLTLRDSGHRPQLSQPEVFSDVVLKFLR